MGVRFPPGLPHGWVDRRAGRHESEGLGDNRHACDRKRYDRGRTIVDWLKWIVVLALVAGGVFGNWYFQESWSLLIRALALVAVGLAAGFIALQTERGQQVWNLAREARVEIRRVVWPTRQQTTQTTGIVLIMILLFSLILWALDSLLSWIVQGVIG